MEFCISSGYRQNFVVRTMKRWCKKPCGSAQQFSKKTLVDVNKGTCFLYTMQTAQYIHGLQAVSPLSILTFGGKRAIVSNDGILLDDILQVSCKPCESLRMIRQKFVTLLSNFLQGHYNPEHVEHFRRFLRYNTGEVECRLLQGGARVPFTPGGSQEHPVLESRLLARERSVIDAEHVRVRLRSFISSGQLLELSQLPACRKHGKHKVSRNRQNNPQYHFFAAVSDGCLTCVRKELEENCQVSPDAVSETNAFSAMDFAAYAVQKGVQGAVAVHEYLNTHWAPSPVQESPAPHTLPTTSLHKKDEHWYVRMAF